MRWPSTPAPRSSWYGSGLPSAECSPCRHHRSAFFGQRLTGVSRTGFVMVLMGYGLFRRVVRPAGGQRPAFKGRAGTLWHHGMAGRIAPPGTPVLPLGIHTPQHGPKRYGRQFSVRPAASEHQRGTVTWFGPVGGQHGVGSGSRCRSRIFILPARTARTPAAISTYRQRSPCTSPDGALVRIAKPSAGAPTPPILPNSAMQSGICCQAKEG